MRWNLRNNQFFYFLKYTDRNFGGEGFNSQDVVSIFRSKAWKNGKPCSQHIAIAWTLWCEKGDSNHIPCSLKPCNCKAWEARLPICLHFCLHSAIQFLGNGCSSLQSFFARKVCISLCTGS